MFILQILNLKNLEDSAENYQQINENKIREKTREENIPFTDMSSIANGFSFFTSFSTVSPDDDRVQENIRKKKMMDNLFLEDLKFMLRHCLSP